MITSKQIINLSEDRLTSGSSSVIYANPTSSDIQELAQSLKSSKIESIRFAADANKQIVYVANNGLIITGSGPKTVMILDNDKISHPPNILYGNSSLSGSSLTFKPSFLLKAQVTKYINSIEFSAVWLKGPNVPNRQKWLGSIRVFRAWLDRFFKYNWPFADRYVSGVSKFVSEEKVRLEEWNSKYRDSLPEK